MTDQAVSFVSVLVLAQPYCVHCDANAGPTVCLNSGRTISGKLCDFVEQFTQNARRLHTQTQWRVRKMAEQPVASCRGSG